jgi:hypothetical protein
MISTHHYKGAVRKIESAFDMKVHIGTLDSDEKLDQNSSLMMPIVNLSWMHMWNLSNGERLWKF